jgi:hypothetical protein
MIGMGSFAVRTGTPAQFAAAIEEQSAKVRAVVSTPETPTEILPKPGVR